MTRWSLRTKIGLGIGAALAVVAAVDVVSHSQLTSLIRVANTLTRTYDILDDLDAVLLHLQNAETGQRGYLLTAEVGYLQPYQAAVRSIDADIEKLRSLLEAGERHAHRERFEQLRNLVGEKLAELDETIRVRRSEGFDAALNLVRTDRGKLIMDRIRLVIDEIRGEEQAILRDQREAVEFSARETIRIIGTGSVVGLVLLVGAGIIIHRDIKARELARDEQSRLEGSLRRSETMSAMGALIAGVAHEVRNPLFGISSAVEAMEARLGPRQEYQNYLRVLRTELDRLTRLMQRLLDYGKPPSDTFLPANAGEVVAGAIEAVKPLASASEVEVRMQVQPDLVPAAIEAERLMQALQHVIDNAVQHSRAGGTVTVEVRQSGNNGGSYIELAVDDDGPGFRPEEVPLVCEPFFTRRRGGTGLGLAIVQRIIEGYQGQILVENRREGGARVALRVPATGNSMSRA